MAFHGFVALVAHQTLLLALDALGAVLVIALALALLLVLLRHLASQYAITAPFGVMLRWVVVAHTAYIAEEPLRELTLLLGELLPLAVAAVLRTFGTRTLAALRAA